MPIIPVIDHLQSQFTALVKCPKPVIGAVHSACVGGGVDLITATDIRLCTQDAYFQVGFHHSGCSIKFVLLRMIVSGEGG